MCCAAGLTLVIFIMWPLLTLPAKVFSRGYFTFWVLLSLVWGTIAGEHTPPFVPHTFEPRLTSL